MTSSLKIGLISICVVGAGLGAYLVKHSLKSDRDVKKSTASSVATGGSTGTSATAGTESTNMGSPNGTGANTLAMTDNNSGHAASPPPSGPSTASGDSERSFRPHTPETTVAPQTSPSTAGTGQDNSTGTGLQNPFAGSLAPSPSGSGTGSTSGTPSPAPTYTPPAPAQSPTPTPTPSNGERMGMRDVTPTGSSTGTTGTNNTAAAKSTVSGPSIPEKTTYHVVQPGETLSSIAAKYLGSSRYANMIAKANPNVRPNRLMVGAKLKIPAAATTQPAAGGTTVPGGQKAAPAPLPPVDPSRAYTVKAGDKWEDLARKFLGNSNWTILYEYNKERFPHNSRALRPGMILEIPPKESPAPKSGTAPKDSATPKDSSAPKK